MVDVVVADEKMPGLSGTELLAWVAEHRPEVVRIVLTGHATVETAIRAINEGGVYHFFTKPCNEFELSIVIHKALGQKDRLRRERELLELAQSPSPSGRGPG
jgi:DNA-binding NtrC family response regulator